MENTARLIFKGNCWHLQLHTNENLEKHIEIKIASDQAEYLIEAGIPFEK